MAQRLLHHLAFHRDLYHHTIPPNTIKANDGQLEGQDGFHRLHRLPSHPHRYRLPAGWTRKRRIRCTVGFTFDSRSLGPLSSTRGSFHSMGKQVRGPACGSDVSVSERNSYESSSEYYG